MQHGFSELDEAKALHLCGQVRPSEGKGNGAFATELIRAHTFLGDYEGELLHEVDYWQRYPTGVVSQLTNCAINEDVQTAVMHF